MKTLLDSVADRVIVHVASLAAQPAADSFRTHLDRLDQGLADIRAAIGEAFPSAPGA
jgi:hypothetical protein